MQRSVLIVEDEASMRMVMQLALEQVGFHVISADSGEAAVPLLAEPGLDVILTDLKMPGMSGHEFIRICQHQRRDVPVIVVTAYGSIRSAIECIQAGASNYLAKPFEPEALQFAVENALRYRNLLRENQQLRSVVQDMWPEPRLLGDSPIMQVLRDKIRVLAPDRSSVMISGEAGTGKLTLAHAIHANGPYAHMPFVVLKCRALASDRIEAVLFGDHAADSSVDSSRRLGKLAQAEGGSLYLDEVDALVPDLQRRLKQVIEDGTYLPIGSHTPRRVNVRFLAGCRENLAGNLQQKGFDARLYQLLSDSTLSAPPLREHTEDIPLLAEQFIAEWPGQTQGISVAIGSSAMQALVNYHWPGNVRELRHSIEYAMLESRGQTIELAHLPTRILTAEARPMSIDLGMLPDEGMDAWLDHAERSLIVQALDACDGIQVNAARRLGINERSLWHRLKKLDIHVNKKVTK